MKRALARSRFWRTAAASAAALLAMEAACRVALPAPPPIDAGQRYLAIESTRPFYRRTVVDGVVAYRFQPKLMNREGKDFRLAKEKDGLRVFIVGESVAAHPANAAALEKLIARLFPGRAVEVFNCSTAGYRIHQWLPTALEVLGYGADYLVVMSGNNEYGAPTPLRDRSIRWRERLKGSRLLWGLVLAADRLTAARRRPEEGPRVDASTARYYEEHLGRLTAAARRAGCRVVLCKLPVNLKRSAPAASIPRDPDSFQRAFRLMDQRRSREAAELYESLLRSEPEHPLSHYYAGLCRAELGDIAGARAHLEKARELDWNRRQRPFVPEVLERASRLPGVAVADIASEFERYFGTPLLGKEAFWDECHWWPELYALTARTIVEAMGLAGSAGTELRRGWETEGRDYARLSPPSSETMLRKVFDSLPVVRDDLPWFRENAVQMIMTSLDRFPREMTALFSDEGKLREILRTSPWGSSEAEQELSSFYAALAESRRRRGETEEAMRILRKVPEGERPPSALLTEGLLLEANGERGLASRALERHRERMGQKQL